MENMAAAVTGYRTFTKHFNRKEYPEYFRSYKEACMPYFMSVPEDAEAREKLAENTLDALEEDRKKIRFRYKRELAKNEDKLFLIMFFAPAAMDSGVPSAALFAEDICQRWNARYPDSPFRIGTYEEIVGGFRNKYQGIFRI